MKRNSDPRHAAASSGHNDESQRRRPAQDAPKGRPASKRPVTVRLPDLTPPVEDEEAFYDETLDEAIVEESYDGQNLDPDHDFEPEPDREQLDREAAPYATRRPEGSVRQPAPAKASPVTKQSASPPKPIARTTAKASAPGQRAVKPEARPVRDANRDANRKSAAPSSERQESGRRERAGERTGERATERTGERRRREASANKPAKGKVGAGPLLIGMGLVGLILAGYAAIQKNSKQSADSGDKPGSEWHANSETGFTPPKIDLPGEAMSPEEFAAHSSSSQPSTDPWDSDARESGDAPQGAIAENDRWSPESEVEFDDEQRYAAAGGEDRRGAATRSRDYEPGSTFNDAPMVEYGRRGERAGAAGDYSAPANDNPYREEAVADARSAAYPSTDPATYSLPNGASPRDGQSPPDGYRLGRRDTYEMDAQRYDDAASGGRTQTDRYIRPQSYDAPGARTADPREYSPRASDPRASDPQTSGYRDYDGQNYDRGGFDAGAAPSSRDGASAQRSPAYDRPLPDSQADDEQLYGDSPAYESANRSSAGSASGGARLQGGVQPSYNGSRNERSGSRLY